MFIAGVGAMQKRYTTKDIANVLGISRGTVDRALHNRGRIKKETKEKVLKIAEELGYKPNTLARTLALRKKVRIAVIMPKLPEYFFSKIENGIRDAARELKDYGVDIAYFYTKAINDTQRQIEIFEKTVSEEFDGILMVPANPVLLKPHIDSAVAEGIPTVVVNNDVPQSSRLCFVGEDSRRAGRIAAELTGKCIGGKGEVVILLGSLQATGACERAEGFRDKIAGSYPGIDIIGSYEYFEEKDEAYRITKELLHDHPGLRGIFLTTTTGMESAADAVIDCGEKDRAIVIGFDINDNIKDLMRKNVIYATICQDPHAQGYYSLRILSKYIIDNQLPKKEFLFTRLEILMYENSVDSEQYFLYRH
jgi:LacI family transcriptional regulator